MTNPPSSELPATSFDLIPLQTKRGGTFFLPRDLVPSQQRAIETTGEYEPDTVAAIQRVARPGMIAVECGSNCGFHTVSMARAVSPGGRVLAYEANPELLSVIEHNVAAAGLIDIVEVHNQGVWREEAILPFPIRKSSLGGAGLKQKSRNPFRRWRGNQKIKHYIDLEVRSLEALCQGYDVGLIRMDIEGAELEAISGSIDFLRTSSAAIILEWIPRAGNRQQTIELFQLLKEAGYQVYRIGPDRLLPIDSGESFYSEHPELWQGDHCDALCLKATGRDE